MINNYTLDTVFIDYSFLKMYKLPDLTKYINLKVLYCNNNKLTELTNLPNTNKEKFLTDINKAECIH